MRTRAQNRVDPPAYRQQEQHVAPAGSSHEQAQSTREHSGPSTHTHAGPTMNVPLNQTYPQPGQQQPREPQRSFPMGPSSLNQPHGLMPPPSFNYPAHPHVNNPSLWSYSPRYVHSPDDENHQNFASYPQSYPYNPGFRQPYIRSSSHTYSTSDADDMYDSDVAGCGDATDLSDAPTSSGAIKVPRPPNAWILYRSEMLREIGEGRMPDGLDDAMNELGIKNSNDNSSPGEEALEKKPLTPPTSASSEPGATEETKVDGTMAPPATRKKMGKGKKGAKAPTPGLLSMGSGKTGRGIPQADISKLISIMWKREKAEVKAVFEGKAAAKKAEHSKNFPGYKFQPMRRADKLKEREEKKQEKDKVRREKELRGLGRRSRRKHPKSLKSAASTSNLQASFAHYADITAQPGAPNYGSRYLTQEYWFDSNERAMAPPERQAQLIQPISLPNFMPSGPGDPPSQADMHGDASASTQRANTEIAPPQFQFDGPRYEILPHDGPSGSTSVPESMPDAEYWLNNGDMSQMPTLFESGDHLSGPYTFQAIGLDPQDLADFASFPPADLQTTEIPDADSLVAMWGHLEEIPEDSPYSFPLGEQSYAAWPVLPEQALEYWPTVEVPISQPYAPVQLSSDIASQIAANWRQEASHMGTSADPRHPTDPSEYVHVSLPAESSGSAPASIPISAPPSSQGGLTGSQPPPPPPQMPQGPLLAVTQPLSPMSWLMPGQVMMQTNSNGNGNGRGGPQSQPSGQSNQGNQGPPGVTAMPPTYTGVPRHVSSTAYPTGDFAYPSAFLSPTAWGDRAVSFSALAADAFEMPGDLGTWDEPTPRSTDGEVYTPQHPIPSGMTFRGPSFSSAASRMPSSASTPSADSSNEQLAKLGNLP